MKNKIFVPVVVAVALALVMLSFGAGVVAGKYYVKNNVETSSIETECSVEYSKLLDEHAEWLAKYSNLQDEHLKLQSEHVEWLAKYSSLQDKHLELLRSKK